MRNVYPTDQVIHIWAHQGQASARNSSNVSFDDKLLYSYSTVIAQLETDTTGELWAFLSSERLTPTTGKHVSSSSQATWHLNQFYTPAFARRSRYGRTINEMIDPAVKQALQDLDYGLTHKGLRAATRAQAIVVYNTRRHDIMRVSAAFKITTPDMVSVSMDGDSVAQYLIDVKAAAEKKAAAELKARLKQQKEDKAQYKAWLTTGAGRCPASFVVRGQDQFTIKGDKIHTSQGAECPLDHAVKALKFWSSRALSPFGKLFEPYHTNGHKIHLGIFTLDSIDQDGTVKAGCHTFSAQEIQRFIIQHKEVLGL